MAKAPPDNDIYLLKNHSTAKAPSHYEKDLSDDDSCYTSDFVLKGTEEANTPEEKPSLSDTTKTPSGNEGEGDSYNVAGFAFEETERPNTQDEDSLSAESASTGQVGVVQLSGTLEASRGSQNSRNETSLVLKKRKSMYCLRIVCATSNLLTTALKNTFSNLSQEFDNIIISNLLKDLLRSIHAAQKLMNDAKGNDETNEILETEIGRQEDDKSNPP